MLRWDGNRSHTYGFDFVFSFGVGTRSLSVNDLKPVIVTDREVKITKAMKKRGKKFANRRSY